MWQKVADGWKYGPTKDPAKKEHPCMVPYADLAPEQQAKDGLFLAVVRAVAMALGDLGDAREEPHGTDDRLA